MSEKETKKKKTKDKAVIIGLDLSLTSSGVVVLVDGGIVHKETITSKPNTNGYYGEIARLLDIVSRISTLVYRHAPTIVAIEGMAFMAKNTTALVQLSALNYFIRRELFISGIPFIIVAPPTLKKFITGHGNAQKDHMMLEIYKRYNETLLDNNQADAYALAQCAGAVIGSYKLPLTKEQNETIQLLKSQVNT
jgi:crossover junction endodeoxyribonuclease RuvC